MEDGEVEEDEIELKIVELGPISKERPEGELWRADCGKEATGESDWEDMISNK